MRIDGIRQKNRRWGRRFITISLRQQVGPGPQGTPLVTGVLPNYMKRVITAQDVPAAGELRVPIGTLVTPSAREVAAGRGVRIVEAAGRPALRTGRRRRRPSPWAPTTAATS